MDNEPSTSMEADESDKGPAQSRGDNLLYSYL